MCDRLDLEVRCYVTGRPDGTIEWQVVTVEGDGQVSWVDGDLSPWAPNRAVTPLELLRVVSRAVRHACFECRTAGSD